MGKSKYIDLKFDSLIIRFDVLLDACKEFETKSRINHSVASFIVVFKKAVYTIKERLNRIKNESESSGLSVDEIDSQLCFVSKCLPHLYHILGLLDHSDTSSVPSEIVAPLSREIQRLLSKSTLIVVSSPELNYRIGNISGKLRKTFLNVKEPVPIELSEQIYRISLPSIECDQSICHCIFAHEIGHVLYSVHGIKSEYETIPLDPDSFEIAFKASNKDSLRLSEADKLLFSDETIFRLNISKLVHIALPNWVEELASDIFGILIFGPAYLFAYIHIFASFALLDNSSSAQPYSSHPPNRLRLRNMCDFVRTRYNSKSLTKSTFEFLDIWSTTSKEKENVKLYGPVDLVALKSIEKASILSKLQNTINERFPEQSAYSETEYKKDIELLGPLIDFHIPPAEYFSKYDKCYIASTFIGIMNAAWDRYLAGLEKYKLGLLSGSTMSPYELYSRFNKFILKAIELSDATHRWRSAKNDLKH